MSRELREDYKVLKILLDSKIGRKSGKRDEFVREVLEMAKLPLFVIDDPFLSIDEFSKALKAPMEYDGGEWYGLDRLKTFVEYTTSDKPANDFLLPFKDAVIKMGMFYFRIYKDPNHHSNFSLLVVRLDSRHKTVNTCTRLAGGVGDEATVEILQRGDWTDANHRGAMPMLLSYLSHYFNYQTMSDNYLFRVDPVESVGSKSLRVKHKPLLTDLRMNISIAPKIIYLDKPPSEVHAPQGGTHASPAGHRRRGHFYTLKHERYRNHPKYLLHNGMWRRTSWIGPKNILWKGHTYQLMQTDMDGVVTDSMSGMIA